MKVNDEMKEQLMNAMFNLVLAINKEADRCGKECGGFNEKEQIILLYLGKNDDAKMSDALANWLPAPQGQFALIVRTYVPGKQILEGEYKLPNVHKEKK